MNSANWTSETGYTWPGEEDIAVFNEPASVTVSRQIEHITIHFNNGKVELNQRGMGTLFLEKRGPDDHISLVVAEGATLITDCLGSPDNSSIIKLNGTLEINKNIYIQGDLAIEIKSDPGEIAKIGGDSWF